MTFVKSARQAGLIMMAAFMFSGAVWAECGFPNSDRGQAPDWLCGEPTFENTDFLFIGDKSRLPSISLQSRLAGKEAMAGVVEKLLNFVAKDLQSHLGSEVALDLEMPNSRDWKRVARFKGIKVVDKTTSPVRHLYVLAGVPSEQRGELLKQAKVELLKTNRGRLKKSLDENQWQAVQSWSKSGE
jgi:hypothetical protein